MGNAGKAGMEGDGRLTVTVVPGQGDASSDALSEFLEEFARREHSRDVSVVSARDVRHAQSMLAHGDAEYALMRGDSLTGFGDEGQYEVVWERDVQVSYVVASSYVCRLGDVAALVVDDDTMGRVSSSLADVMGDHAYVRYGCDDGDEGARRLKEQPHAYMAGTAVVCSEAACDAARLRRLTSPFVDAGCEGVRFVAIRRRCGGEGE